MSSICICKLGCLRFLRMQMQIWVNTKTKVINIVAIFYVVICNYYAVPDVTAVVSWLFQLLSEETLSLVKHRSRHCRWRVQNGCMVPGIERAATRHARPIYSRCPAIMAIERQLYTTITTGGICWGLRGLLFWLLIIAVLVCMVVQ